MTKPQLLNLSNHPAATWTSKQIETAKQQYSEIVDMPFPNVSPMLSSEDLDKLVDEYEDKLMASNIKHVHIAGELNFVFRMVTRLKAKGVICITSTTERIAVVKDEKKTSTFRFVQFREY